MLQWISNCDLLVIADYPHEFYPDPVEQMFFFIDEKKLGNSINLKNFESTAAYSASNKVSTPYIFHLNAEVQHVEQETLLREQGQGRSHVLQYV